ncbi:hypothetical protein K493DRAFT_310137 [Basidiobolus meristosporus CBS 931.73]|uniref:GSKIP domain-containing protein n=1 Tax=Basidiobolus meristosporus CBS 931.73 TaxID=1314790 RepID=A0A1Y1ZBA9_9FUNG|nr:hypothetical protein K493DRAFT_310137 [Basidiobolus meristosporus CBS 931.73]|eukprot:ORY07593.1 hypothetical protein K493DRAFT_310137 [Basidiobolus meristosporus CBS 931.73]
MLSNNKSIQEHDLIQALREIRSGINEDSLIVNKINGPDPMNPNIPWGIFSFTLLEGISVTIHVDRRGYCIAEAELPEPCSKNTRLHYDSVITRLLKKPFAALDLLLMSTSPLYLISLSKSMSYHKPQLCDCSR